MMPQRLIKCERCGESFNPTRDVPSYANPFRCEWCGKIHTANSKRHKPKKPKPKNVAGEVPDKKVYAIHSESGETKIGISVTPTQRLKSIQTGSPHELEILATGSPECAKEYEEELHKRYAEYNKNREWFDLPTHERESLISEINSL